mmetsp:Transcript_20815/g.34408  ORF Transcript_20815/g.34408 Transcript_20815/m.34408 type:complete len:90 (-) Transcript_20815:145-414(-)
MATTARMQRVTLWITLLLFLVVALSGCQAYEANDGSAAGRKLERERRRAEMRKNNPNFKEKTPAQKAEIERKRQERMAEEAARFQGEDL